MHISSLPGPEGIGSLGQEAFDFADALSAAGCSLWQVLPCCPTGYGESPYQSPSVFAGNPLFISTQRLILEGILHPPAAMQTELPQTEKVDFEAVRVFKEKLLREAFRQSAASLQDEIDCFARENPWVHDYSLFTALKAHFGGVKYADWPDRGLRFRKRASIRKAGDELQKEISYHTFVQYLFFRQWQALRRYCHDLGILLFGDMPIYVAEDSADVWVHPDIFQLDSKRIPKRVAGVPPDYFSEDGQLWGNPLYRWNWLRYFHRYDWWVARMRHMQHMYDLIRIDHFIGFANYWSVKHGEPTARYGKWVPGPGKSLFERFNRELKGLHIVAEDLGEINDSVLSLLAFTGYPGMRVLSYGFGGGSDNMHHPDNLKKNAVVYTGTHDNDTLRSWLEHASPEEQTNLRKLWPYETIDEGIEAMVRGAFESPCDACVIPMQDLLGLGGEARMNLPGTVGGNWLWRMRSDAFTPQLIARIHKLNSDSGRLKR